jgi:hypothetical protein
METQSKNVKRTGRKQKGACTVFEGSDGLEKSSEEE